MKLTDTFLNSIRANGKRQQYYEPNGFGVIIHPAGTRTFYYRYMLRGKARRLKLGTYPAISLANARKAHAEAMADAQRARDEGGADPSDMRAHKLAVAVQDKNVRQLAVAWIEDKRALGIVKAEEYRRILDADVLDKWGGVRVRDVRRGMIVSLLDAKKKSAPGAARELLKVLRNMFAFACERDETLANPCADVKQPAKYMPRERALSSDELAQLLPAIDKLPMFKTAALMTRFMLLTLVRQGEIRLAKWGEIDEEQKLWTIPAARIKTRSTRTRDFLVPLSAQAIKILKKSYGLPGAAPGTDDFIFPSPSGAAIGVNYLDHVLRKEFNRESVLKMSPFTPHDLRRTAATRLGELGVQPHILDRLLNHVDKSTTGIYNVYEYLDEKRAALRLWANTLDALKRGAA